MSWAGPGPSIGSSYSGKNKERVSKKAFAGTKKKNKQRCGLREREGGREKKPHLGKKLASRRTPIEKGEERDYRSPGGEPGQRKKKKRNRRCRERE